MPVLIKFRGAVNEIKNALSWAALFTGTVIIDEDPTKEFKSISLTGDKIYRYKSHSYSDSNNRDCKMNGFIVSPDSDMEITISSRDRELKGRGVCENYDIIVCRRIEKIPEWQIYYDTPEEHLNSWEYHRPVYNFIILCLSVEYQEDHYLSSISCK